MIANSIMNKFGSKRKRLENRLLISLCIFCCLCGIPFCTRGGIYIFHAIENLNSNWNSFSLSLVQVLVVCHVYGVENFLEDIGEMLRAEKPPSPVLITGISQEQFLWHRLCYFFGPCGGYIKWMWSLFAPIVLILLLFASILSYERVQFNNVELPFVFEMIAWITMIGPLLIVPGAAIWNIIEAFRKERPIRDVFGSNNWRHKDEENKQPKHQDEGRPHQLYSYIDPLSRGTSAKSNRNVFNHSSSRRKEHDDERYARVTQQLRQWTKQAGNNTSESNLTDRPKLNHHNFNEHEEAKEWREAQYNRIEALSVVTHSMQQGFIQFPFHSKSKQKKIGVIESSVLENKGAVKADHSFIFGPPPQQIQTNTYQTKMDTDEIELNSFPLSHSVNKKIIRRPEPIVVKETQIDRVRNCRF